MNNCGKNKERKQLSLSVEQLEKRTREKTELYTQIEQFARQNPKQTDFKTLAEIAVSSKLPQLVDPEAGCQFIVAAPLFLELKNTFRDGINSSQAQELADSLKQLDVQTGQQFHREITIAVYLLGLTLGYDKTYDAYYDCVKLPVFSPEVTGLEALPIATQAKPENAGHLAAETDGPSEEGRSAQHSYAALAAAQSQETDAAEHTAASEETPDIAVQQQEEINTAAQSQQAETAEQADAPATKSDDNAASATAQVKRRTRKTNGQKKADTTKTVPSSAAEPVKRKTRTSVRKKKAGTAKSASSSVSQTADIAEQTMAVTDSQASPTAEELAMAYERGGIESCL